MKLFLEFVSLIRDGLIRISVGLEEVKDIQADLERGLAGL
jgi:cystathionine beta-lyase/cystathionine gamma-synthase